MRDYFLGLIKIVNLFILQPMRVKFRIWFLDIALADTMKETFVIKIIGLIG